MAWITRTNMRETPRDVLDDERGVDLPVRVMFRNGLVSKGVLPASKWRWLPWRGGGAHDFDIAKYDPEAPL